MKESIRPIAIVRSRDQELEETRRQLELAVEGAKLGTWTFDPQTGEIWYSDRSREIYGLDRDARLDAPTLQSRVHPEDWDRLAAPYFQGFPAESIEAEYRVVHPDGQVRWIYALGAAPRGNDDTARTVHGIHLDITERRRADDDLEQTRLKLQMAIESAQLGSWTMDAETGEFWFSDRSREIYGVDRDIPLHTRTLKPYVHPDDWERVSEPYNLGFPSDTISIEHRVIRPNGEMRWVYSLGAAARDAQGAVRTINGIHMDITERKRAEEELARSRDALHQSEKLAALGSLLAGVSHELNNPLAAIVGQSGMLEEDAAGTAFEARAKKISAAAERCARIVQTFLAMARQKEPQRGLVNLNELIASALELTEYALRTAGISVRVNFGSGLPPVEGDRDQLHQVLVNLIINAQQAMEGGEIFDKTLTIRTSVDQAGAVLADIGDTGPGVPAEVRGRIFDPFFTTKPMGSGTGLGLSFSHGIVQAHGGSLTLESSRRGALFRVSLPAAAQGGIVAAPVAEATDLVAGSGRALVVEDEPDVADTLRELLEREGYRVTLAGDGAAALVALDGGEFDLLLSDLRMPGVSGPELYARLAEARPDLLARIGFITGDTLGSSMDEFLRGTGRPVLEKPFTKAGVRGLIAAVNGQSAP